MQINAVGRFRFTAARVQVDTRPDKRETDMPMFNLTRSRPTRRGTFSRGTVHCPKCSGAIHVFKIPEISDEFSLSCRACGARSLHAKRDMSVEQFIDRRSKPRAA